MSPDDGVGRGDPALGEASVFIGGKGLQRTGKSGEEEGERGGKREAAVPEDEVDPDAGPGEGGEDGDLVVSGEEGDAEEHAGEGGAGPGPALGGAELEEEDEGGPDRAIHHHRPGDAAEKTGEAEDESSGERGGAGTAESAAEQV